MFAKAGIQPNSATNGIARGQSPDGARPVFRGSRDRLTPVSMPAPSAAAAANPAQLIESTVRLKVEDPTGSSYGTGTLIDTRQGDALVLTCGHIFRDSAGKGTIKVDLCGPGAPQQLPGRLVSFDLEKDIALVSVRPGVPIVVAPVAPKGQAIAPGVKVITVGCNHGGPATALHSQIASLDKFLGPPNLQVAGAAGGRTQRGRTVYDRRPGDRRVQRGRPGRQRRFVRGAGLHPSGTRRGRADGHLRGAPGAEQPAEQPAEQRGGQPTRAGRCPPRCPSPAWRWADCRQRAPAAATTARK